MGLELPRQSPLDPGSLSGTTWEALASLSQRWRVDGSLHRNVCEGLGMPYYVVNAGRGRSTHIMKSNSPRTPNPLSPGGIAAQLLWFGGNPKFTLCGLQATRYVDVFSPSEASCRECSKRWQAAGGEGTRRAQQQAAHRNERLIGQAERDAEEAWTDVTPAERAVALWELEHGCSGQVGEISDVSLNNEGSLSFTLHITGDFWFGGYRGPRAVDITLPKPTPAMLVLRDGATIRVTLNTEERMVHLEHVWNADGTEGGGILASEIVPEEERQVREAQKQVGQFNALAGVAAAPAATEAGSDPAVRLRKLQELRDAGLLTQDEYETKRSEIINSI
jgi:Short C-terminal domain